MQARSRLDESLCHFRCVRFGLIHHNDNMSTRMLTQQLFQKVDYIHRCNPLVMKPEHQVAFGTDRRQRRELALPPVTGTFRGLPRSAQVLPNKGVRQTEASSSQYRIPPVFFMVSRILEIVSSSQRRRVWGSA